ncbi:MAG: hypothetical protein ACRDJH_05335 [Thermomicrobiales bacterium]
MSVPVQSNEAVRQLQIEHGWTEDEARRFLAHARKMLLNDIVFDRPLTADERREIGVDAKFGDELDEDDALTPPTDDELTA